MILDDIMAELEIVQCFFFGSPSVSNKLVFIQIQFIANEMHICEYVELQI